MLSDRELSALVAEKVMGWKLNHDIFSDRQWVDSNGRGVTASDRFATDPGLALEAAMKATKKSLRIEVPSRDEIRFAVCEYVIQGRADEGTTEEYAVVGLGSTISRALCLYALRAVGVEVQDDKETR